MNDNDKTELEAQNQPSCLGGVSGSLSAEDVKWLIYYGHDKAKTVIIDEDKGHLDWAIMNMFLMMKESSRFDSEKVETLFWERVRALANYR